MDENNNSNHSSSTNNELKRSRATTRSPSTRTPGTVLSADDSSERSRSEHSMELTLPPKKSSKHYNRRAAAKNTSLAAAVAPNGGVGGGGGAAAATINSINNGRSSSCNGGLDSTSDKENFCDRDKLMGDAITGDGPYQQMRLPDGQLVLMLQPHYMQLAAALGINAHDGMNQMMDFESLIELSRKHQHVVSGGGGGMQFGWF